MASEKRGELVRDMGVGFEIVKAISDAILALGGTDDDLPALLKDKSKLWRIAEIILEKDRGLSPKQKLVSSLVMIDDWNVNFGQLTTLFHAVDHRFRDAKFEPIASCRNISTKAHEVTFEYVHLDRKVSTQSVLAEMERLGVRPALCHELVVFGVMNPGERRIFPIPALGSVALLDGRHHVASFDISGLSLGLMNEEPGYYRGCRFLAVRK